MSEEEILKLTNIAESYLGKVGISLAPNRSKYKEDNSDNIIIYGAVIYIDKNTSIWRGDLNITQEYSELKRLSKKLDKKLYISYDYFLSKVNLDKCIIIYHNLIEFPVDSEVFYFSNEKVPKQLTHAEYEKKFPKKTKNYEYKEENFASIKLPNPLKFKIKKDVSPIDTLQRHLIKKFTREGAQEIYKNLYITPEYEDKLRIQLKKALKKSYPYMSAKSIKSSIEYQLFDAPYCFSTRPVWAEPHLGYVYIKK